MLSVNVEQHVNVKFCLKLGKSATETYDLLKKVYGDECLSRTQVFERLKRFKEGREEIEDYQRHDRPSTSKTGANIEKVGEFVRQRRGLSIRAVAEFINIDKETVRQILHNNFNMKKVCSKMVPRLLTPEQKEIRMNICADILQNIENDPNFLENVITCGESWFFQYDPDSKRNFMLREEPHSPRKKKKTRQSKSKFKAMTIFFSDIQGIGHVDWVPEGQTVNQVYYKEVLANLCEWMKRRRRRRRIRRRRRRRRRKRRRRGGEGGDDGGDDLKCGRTAREFFTKTTRRHTTPCLSRLFDKAQDHRAGTSIVLT